MSIQPGQHNISLQRRADFDLQLEFKDAAGVGIDLTGWTNIISCQHAKK